MTKKLIINKHTNNFLPWGTIFCISPLNVILLVEICSEDRKLKTQKTFYQIIVIIVASIIIILTMVIIIIIIIIISANLLIVTVISLTITSNILSVYLSCFCLWLLFSFFVSHLILIKYIHKCVQTSSGKTVNSSNKALYLAPP